MQDYIYVRGHLINEQFIVHIEPGMQEGDYLDPDHFNGPEALMYKGGTSARLAYLVTDVFSRQYVVCKNEGGPAYEYIDRLVRGTFARMMNLDGAQQVEQRKPPIRPVRLVPPPSQARNLSDEETHAMQAYKEK